MGISQSFPLVQLPRDKIVIVTGANSGIGYEIAKWTAMMGATVIMACRSESKAKECEFTCRVKYAVQTDRWASITITWLTMKSEPMYTHNLLIPVTDNAIHRMNAEFTAEKARGTTGLSMENELALEFMQLRLDSFKSVLEFVEKFTSTGRQLHVLFCNAGIALEPYRRTEDGFESVLQVNYLSHFLLVCKLLPIMRHSGPDCRILFMSSIYHNWCTFDIDTINYTGTPENYSAGEYYGRSKLYQIMQMYSMHRRLQGTNITVNSVHPGAVNTNIAEVTNTCFLRIFVFMFKTFGKTPERAARCSVNCVTNPRLADTSGIYFVDFSRTTPSSQARNEKYQEVLWRKSFEILKPYLTQDEMSYMEGKELETSKDT